MLYLFGKSSLSKILIVFIVKHIFLFLPGFASPAVSSQVTAMELEHLMVRLPSMFKQELSGVGANLEKRWKFCGFDSPSTA